MSSSQDAPARAKRTTRTRTRPAANRTAPQEGSARPPTNDTPATVRSPRPAAHPLLALGFPGLTASATKDRGKARPSGSSAPSSATAQGSTTTGGEPPSSSSYGRELAALRASVAELRGTVEHLREDLDVLEERTRPHKAAAKAGAAVLLAARGRVATLGEGLGDVEGRLARAAERRPRKRRAAPIEPTEQSAKPEAPPAVAPSPAPGPSAALAEHLHGIARDLARARFHMNGGSPVRDQFPVMMNAIETCLLSGEKHAHDALASLPGDAVPTPRAAIADLVSIGGEPSEALARRKTAPAKQCSEAIPPPPPNPRFAHVDAARLSVDDIKNARELLLAVHAPLHDLWEVARDGSAPNGARVWKRSGRRERANDDAFNAFDLLRCVELTLDTIHDAALAARRSA